MFRFLLNLFSSKPRIPYRNEYFPSIQEQPYEIKKFYHYLSTEIEKGNYIELWDSLAYIFAYLYSIINDYIFTRDIKTLEYKAEKLLNLYGHTKIKTYLSYWWRDCYFLQKDYKKAWQITKQFNMDIGIWELLFYSKKWVLDDEKWKDFLELFGMSWLTKFGRQNLQWIEKVLDVFLKDFQQEHGMRFVDFFCQDFQKKEVTEEDIEKYRIFFKSDKEFELYKSYDLNRYGRDINMSPYIRKNIMSLFWSVRIDERNSKQHIFHNTTFVEGVGTFTLTTKLPTRLPDEYALFNPEIVEPWYTIKKALSNHAKNIIKDAENIYREESWIPKIWEWWVTETELFYKIKKHFPNEKVIHHWRPQWLGRQHLDIFFPERNIGIEYQGKQHLEPVAYFGGQDAFQAQQQRDIKKVKKCKTNKCFLIHVYEWYNLNEIISQISEHIKKSTIAG